MSNVRPVYATQTTMVDGMYKVTRGEVRDETDPVVRAAPHLFSADPRSVMVSNIPGFLDSLDDPPVEQATAAPGERRSRVHRG